MRIVQVRTHLLKVPLSSQHSFYSSQASFPARESLLVEVVTQDGVTGWGEAGQYGPGAPIATVVEKVFWPIIQQLPNHAPRVLWERLYAMHRDFGAKGPYIEALSGLDVALWDAYGKTTGRSVAELLGGRQRDSVVAYATGCYFKSRDFDSAELPRLGEEANSYVEAGFHGLKMKVGLYSLAAERQRVSAVRDALGEGFPLMVDANHAYSAVNAISLGRHLEQAGVRWFEEPVVPEDRDGYRRVRDALSIPIAGGEAEYTRYGFRDLIADGCVDIAQPDLGVCGGFSELLAIASIASANSVSVVPHIWGSGIALAAGLQAIAMLPNNPHTLDPKPFENEPVLEYDQTANPLRDDLVPNLPMLQEGRLQIPAGGGLGVEVDREVLKRYEQE